MFLKGNCRYGLHLSYKKELLAIVDTTTQEEIEVTENELRDYMKFIRVVDKPAVLQKYKDLINSVSVGRMYVKCVREKEVIVDGKNDCYVSLTQEPQVYYASCYSKELNIYATNPIKMVMNGKIDTFRIGVDTDLMVNSDLELLVYGAEKGLVRTKGHRNQKLLIRDTETKAIRVDNCENLDITTLNTQVKGDFIIRAYKGIVDIKECDIYISLDINCENLDLNMEGGSVKGYIEIGNNLEEVESANITINNTKVSTLQIHSLTNLNLKLNADISVLRIEIYGIEEFSTNWVIDITTVDVVEINLVNMGVKELLNSTDFFKFMSKMQTCGKLRIFHKNAEEISKELIKRL